MKHLRALLMAVLASSAAAQSLDELKIGHWVEVKGELVGPFHFRASAVEVLAPETRETLIGTATDVSRTDASFRVLGQVVSVSDKTEWKGLELRSLEGHRVKVQGHYRGTQKFSARSIELRQGGRDRIVGRIDALEGASDREAQLLGFHVTIPRDVKLENASSFASVALAPEVEFETRSGQRANDDDDYIPGSIYLTDTLTLGGLVEYKGAQEKDYDFDSDRNRNERNQRLALRAQLLWTPSERFDALFSPRFEIEDRRKRNSTQTQTAKPHVNEAWAAWHPSENIDLRVGRQDFDDLREWVYKHNLDGARAIFRTDALRLELSGTTVVDDGSDRDKHTDNWMAYLSNGDDRRHLAAYVVDRRDSRSPREYPIHFGVRAIGEFLPDQSSWLEASLLRGYADDINLSGYAFDVGTTWSPAFADPLSFTVGFAFGSGDDSPSDGTDHAFRQTGFQRNNGKFGGVTSFRYYGEILDPELSNLAIWTAGIGARPTRKSSIDLVYHHYAQVEAADFLRDTDLQADPDGVHKSLGQELDLIVGTKAWRPWDFEVVVGWFDPASAFPDGDDAWLVTFQARYRF